MSPEIISQSFEGGESRLGEPWPECVVEMIHPPALGCLRTGANPFPFDFVRLSPFSQPLPKSLLGFEQLTRIVQKLLSESENV
jgi:hypothetical protein